jgi:hypothetical protein
MRGLLINGYNGGTQIFDPVQTPHAIGDLQLGLPSTIAAFAGGAVRIGGDAYFVGSGRLFNFNIEIYYHIIYSSF